MIRDTLSNSSSSLSGTGGFPTVKKEDDVFFISRSWSEPLHVHTPRVPKYKVAPLLITKQSRPR